MKTSWLTIALLALTVIRTQGQVSQSGAPASAGQGTIQAQDTPYAVVERGANHRIWQKTTYETAPSGRKVPHIHQYTELATGLHYKKNGQWVESKEEIDILQNGTAAATQGQHQAHFPGDIYQGVVELVTPDGLHLQSRPLGLSYDDGNRTVLIAELKDSVGQLVGSNQVIYSDAFTDFKADLVCTYRKSGFECDLVFREQPPLPEAYGLDPQTSRLELLTEFFNTPEPVATTSGVSKSDGLSDTTLKFGTMTMGRGKAFVVGDSISDDARKPSFQIPVYKSWLHLQGRTLLVEEVPYRRISSQVQALPVPANAASSASSAGSVMHKVSATRLLPPVRLVQASTNRVQLAKTDLGWKRGVVLDYVGIDSIETNAFTFQGDTTYFITGDFILDDTVTFEGGTVLKFDTLAIIEALGSPPCAVWETTPYRPAIFTSMDDNTVGETIYGSSGNPSTRVGDNYYIWIGSDPEDLPVVMNARFSYADDAIAAYPSCILRNCQFNKCGIAILLTDWDNSNVVELHNVLFSACGNVLSYFGWTPLSLTAEQITVDRCDSFTTGTQIFATNSIFANTPADTNSTLAGLDNGFYNSPEFGDYPKTNTVSPFQTVGAGSYYLATNSPYRNMGTTNISLALLAELRLKTTYPPIVYSNATISTLMTFSPQAQRDTDMPDLGYHYDPLDHVFGGVHAASNLTFTAGTVVGWFELPGSGGAGYGISLTNSSTATFDGTVTLPCVLARYETVQEGGNGRWTDKGWLGAIIALGDTPGNVSLASQTKATFTHFAALANDPNNVRDYTSDFVLQANNCEFWSGDQGGYGIHLYLTNCLINGCYLGIQAASSVDSALVMRNCTMREGCILATHWDDAIWPTWIENCVFERTDLSQMDDPSGGDTNITYCDFNAFITNQSRLPVLGAHDVNVTNFNWQSSWLGNYYLPTNSPLINTGSVTANVLGLYHFTTQTNQVKETNSMVDIGYHYVATDNNGNSFDTDGDNIPDYQEDANGNGSVDSGETDWKNPDTDYDGRNDGQELADGTDPLDANSVTNTLLGYWRFDNTNTWVGEEGQLPLLATNIVGVPSWSTNAVLIDSTNPAILAYRDVETNGNANINLRTGTIRFWFKPDWSSGDLYGTGPQTMGRLIEVGNYNPAFINGWWALYLSPDGTQLTFGSSTNGAGNTNLSASVSWAFKRWHQIVLTYSPTNSTLYWDGYEIAPDGTGPNYYPGLTGRTNGFRIGSDANGANQARGVFENLETFNYQLTATDIADDYNYTTNLMPAPPTVTITNLTDHTTHFVGTNQALTIEVDTKAGPGRFIREVDYSYNVYESGGDPPIGISTQYPFPITWMNTDWTNTFVDAYDITAIAIDNTGVASDPYSVNDVTIMLDSDSDGIPDQWMLRYFGHPTGETWDHSLAGNDADGDGFSNLQEYQNGTNPTYYYDVYNDLEIVILSGGNQSGNYGSFLPLPLTIKVLRSDFLAFTNAPVDFTVTAGTALLSATTTDSPASTLSLQTDSNGLASAWVYFPAAGSEPPDSTILINAYSGNHSTTVAAHEYVPLARWHFNDTNTWIGEAGQLPLLTNNLIGVPDWSSNAVRIDSASPVQLVYDVVEEANGSTNINCQTGSVLFYFKPDWSSVNQGGTGPGTSGRLIEMGNYNPAFTNGWWAMFLNTDGKKLSFGTSTNGGGEVNLTANISWVSNTWYQIALVYSLNGSALFVDGQLLTNGVGVVYLPNSDELANGFRIGSDQDGNNQAGGAFDELETFASPLNFGITPAETYWTSIPDYKADHNATLGAWLMAYFGHLGVEPFGDYDNDGTNNWQEFANGADPNKISFSFSVANQYVTTNVVSGVITILNGVPNYCAALVDTTNFTEATWNTYTSSNIVVDIGTTQGAHDVWIGLRGLPANAQQTWEGTTLILNSNPPAIAITSPVDSASFNSSRVNVSGNFTAGTLKQITVNSTLAFVNGTNFEARNVPLTGGTNIITAVIEDLTGTTNAVSIVVTGTTNADGSLNDPVQLQATPVAGFAPLAVVFQITSNSAPGTIQQVLYDFNGDDITDFTTNNPGSFTYTYETNGEYFPVVIIQTDAGRFSSVGGWNSASLDDSNQPVRINVQSPPTQTVTLSSFPKPVDLKWDGTHLYVLSGNGGSVSGGAIYEFATNGDTIHSLSLSSGSNPSGLDVDSAGNVYVAVTGSNQVWKFFPTNSSFQADTNFGVGGCIGLTNGAAGSNTNEFNAPFDVAVSPDGGTISVSDSSNNRIQQFSAADGSFVAAFGQSGSGIGQFNTPKGLMYDSSGTLYIVDSMNNRIVLAQGSAVMDATGSGGNGLGQFNGPLNISVGKRGVYVADTVNNRIQKFDLPAQGDFSITSGNMGYALSTGLSAPAAVAAVDHLTNELFYVADTGNNRVLLCHLPDSNADEIQAVWNGMTTCVANGNISGAAQYFCSKTADGYLQAFLCIGSAKVISDINEIGPLTPVYIENGLAEYYFEQTIGGQTLLFPVQFEKENGTWKIFEF